MLAIKILSCKVILMTNITEIIDKKFEEAIESWVWGANSTRASMPIVGPLQRVIALDSEEGPDSRCLLSRHSPDIPGVEIDDVDVLTWGVEIPRTRGDRRLFELLPVDAIKGHLFYIGRYKEEILIIGDGVRSDWLSLEGLGVALSKMRVVHDIPSGLED